MTDICSLCLGGKTDIPPFGNLEDAKDLIHPCMTCSIVTHRKCLIDWFNSLDGNKLQIIDSVDFNPINNAETPENNANFSNATAFDTTDNDTDGAGIGGRILNLEDFELGGTTTINLQLSTQHLNEWFNNITTSSNYRFQNSPNIVYLIAKCPQCKSDIIFSIKRSAFLSLSSGLKTVLTRSIQYSTVFIGFTSAITGVVSMGYIGLTSCGLKMMDCIFPQSLLVKMLSKPSSGGNQTLLNSILFRSSYSIDNLEMALSKGLIDPFKFSRIPVLPIILYRMRQSSFVQCLFDNSKSTSYQSNFGNWLTEFMINGYVSSLGDHILVRSIYNNISDNISNIIRDPIRFYNYFNVLQGIDFWDIRNMVSMLIPTRIAYDFLYRLTINQFHFNIVMRSKPRDIANNLSTDQLDNLEVLNSKLNNLKLILVQDTANITNTNHTNSKLFKWLVAQKNLVQRLFKNGLIWKIIKYQVYLTFYKSMACVKNDYSGALMYNSTAIRGLTTVVWPLISSKLGGLIFSALKDKFNQEPDKIMVFSNLIGLVLVVLAKDLMNLYLSYKKSKELSNLRISNYTSQPNNEHAVNLTIPGNFQV